MGAEQQGLADGSESLTQHAMSPCPSDPYFVDMATLLPSSVDIVLACDLAGAVTAWNRGAERILGYSTAEILGSPIHRLLPSDKRDDFQRNFACIGQSDLLEQFETNLLTKSGSLVETAINAYPARGADGTILGISIIARDIGPMMAREREISRLARLYAALSHINQAIVRMPSRDRLCCEICQVLVEHGAFQLAWIGWRDPATERLVPIAQAGDENNYLQNVEIYVDERPEGQGPSGRAFRAGNPYICNDIYGDPATTPWREEQARRHFRASAVFPIREGGVVCGALNVYSETRHFFQDREIALLQEAASDISFALDNLAREEVRRQAEEKLFNEKLFSDTMIASMPGILYFYDMAGRFLRWNQSFVEVSGYTADEIAEMHPLDFFVGEHKAHVEERIAEVFEKGVSSVEANFSAKDGTETPYFFTGRSVNFNGKACLVGVGIDVSAHKRAKDLLAESEHKYRELVELANSIILRWNAEGRITFLNEFGQAFFGYSAEEILGRHVVGTIVPETTNGGHDLSQLMADICANPSAFEKNVNENIRRNGDRVTIAWTNKIIQDADGAAVEILSVGTDISEQQRAEEARAKSEARYRTLFEYAPDGIVIADKDSYYLDANAAMCNMLGYTREEFIGLHASDIVVPSEIAQIDQALEIIKAKADHQREWAFRRKDGSTFPAEVLATLMPDGLLMGMIRDITERKQAEAALHELNETLEQKVITRTEELQTALIRAQAADRTKSGFLATMSHELRTPLNSIIGFTGILLQKLAGPLNEEQDKQLEMVRGSARHLLTLINDVLDISKIEAGQLEVAITIFDPRESITKVCGLVRPLAEKKGLPLRLALAEDLGLALGDERRFQQILLNLLSNAIKFSDRGEITLSAAPVTPQDSKSCKVRLPALRVAIKDCGIGIRPEDLETLFQPFRQIESGLARNYEGTGLGLAICRRLAALMHGEVHAESVWGEGSTFSVILPLNAESQT